jgi:hypothetical protein
MLFEKLAFAHKVLRAQLEKTAIIGAAMKGLGTVMGVASMASEAKGAPKVAKAYRAGFDPKVQAYQSTPQ